MVNVADAILARDGFRLRGKTGSHQARFEYPGLPEAFTRRVDYLEDVRRLRSEAMYERPDVVSPEQDRHAIEVAEIVRQDARRLLGQ